MKKLIQRIKDLLFKEDNWIDDIIRNGFHYPRTKRDEQIISLLKRYK